MIKYLFILFLFIPMHAQNADLPQGNPQKGAEIFQTICSTCHSLSRAKYEDFIILSPHQYDKIIAWTEERKAKLTDHISSPYHNEEEGRALNGGDYPPDLSIITRTIKGKEDYIEKMLMDYHDFPPGMKHGDHEYYNPTALTHHHRFRMPPPLNHFQPAHNTQEAQQIKEDTANITAFLKWSADPHEKTRWIAGIGTIIYLASLALVLLLVMHNIWRNKK